MTEEFEVEIDTSEWPIKEGENYDAHAERVLTEMGYGVQALREVSSSWVAESTTPGREPVKHSDPAVLTVRFIGRDLR